jgi:DNA-binding MarR family transcriptional regulator
MVVSLADTWYVLAMKMSDELTQVAERPLPSPQANLGYLFRLAFQRYRLALEEELSGLGLSAQEYSLLSLFDTRPELSTADLARLAQVTRQTMHTAVLGLETAGLVERRAKNRRVVLVAPTEAGREHLQAATERVRAIERAALSGLSADEERVVREWLARLAAMTADEGRR